MIVPAGTQVVTQRAVESANGRAPEGAVGVIVKVPVDPQHAYRVRFPDGVEVSIARTEFVIRKDHARLPGRARALPPSALDGSAPSRAIVDEPPDLRAFVIYRCVVGSRAYGLDHEGSDTDRRGVYLPPADLHWSLVRLLLSGITALREGHVPVRVPEAQREPLLAIRRGERTWEDVDAWRRGLHAEFDAAYEKTHLPDRPDYARANDLLLRARRSMVP